MNHRSMLEVALLEQQIEEMRQLLASERSIPLPPLDPTQQWLARLRLVGLPTESPNCVSWWRLASRLRSHVRVFRLFSMKAQATSKSSDCRLRLPLRLA